MRPATSPAAEPLGGEAEESEAEEAPCGADAAGEADDAASSRCSRQRTLGDSDRQSEVGAEGWPFDGNFSGDPHPRLSTNFDVLRRLDQVKTEVFEAVAEQAQLIVRLLQEDHRKLSEQIGGIHRTLRLRHDLSGPHETTESTQCSGRLPCVPPLQSPGPVQRSLDSLCDVGSEPPTMPRRGCSRSGEAAALDAGRRSNNSFGGEERATCEEQVRSKMCRISVASSGSLPLSEQSGGEPRNWRSSDTFEDNMGDDRATEDGTQCATTEQETGSERASWQQLQRERRRQQLHEQAQQQRRKPQQQLHARAPRPPYLPSTRAGGSSFHSSGDSTAGDGQPYERVTGGQGWEERPTLNSNISSMPKVHSIGGLDDFLTDALFEQHGLAPSRNSFGNRRVERVSSNGGRPSFGSNPARPSFGNSIGGSLNQVKSLFWKGGTARPSVPQGFDDIGGSQGSQDAVTVGRSAPDLSTARPSLPKTLKVNLSRVRPDDGPVDASPGGSDFSGSDNIGCSDGSGSAVEDFVGGGRSPQENLTIASVARFARRATGAMTSSVSSMDALRMEHEDRLVARAEGLLDSEGAAGELAESQYSGKRPLPCIVLAASGIIPFGRGTAWWLWGQFVLLAVASLTCGIVMLAREGNETRTRTLYWHLTAGCVSVGGFLALIFLRWQHIQDLLGPRKRPLELYASAFGFLDSWHLVSSRRFSVVLSLWILSSLSQVVMNLRFGCPQAHEPSLAACAINFVGTGILCCAFYCMLHICCGLELAIDHYCIRFFENQNLAKGIVEWNVLQAMLRRAAHTVEGAFVAASTGVLGVVVLTSVEIFNMFNDASGRTWMKGNVAEDGMCMGLWAGWVLPPTALVFYSVFRAAAVTEQANRVPALVNSWMLTGQQIDQDKQYVVQYIIHSAAGFYVKGVRLNATWALKLSYLFGVLLFSLLTQSVLKGG